MSKTFLVLVAMAVLASVPSLTQASLVNTGDHVIVTQGPGGADGGGSFKVENVTTASGPDLFRTFCIEVNEHFSPGGTYEATIETDAIYGGAGVAVIGPPAYAGAAGTPGVNDPISPLTAWLYSNAVGGTLTGYSAASTTANNALQNAIWYLENEVGSLTSAGQAFYDLAVAAKPTDIGSVRVMNLWEVGGAYTQAGKKQSMLVMVPEATTIIVWSVLGLIGFAGRRYRA